MKILKRIFLGLLLLIGVALIAALFVDGDISTERSIVINRPVGEVYNYVKHLKNQDHYAKWNRMEPTMKKSYKGTDGQVGFVSSWEGEEVGAGEQTITAMKEGERVEQDLHFIKPFESRAKAYMTTKPAGAAATEVTWGFTSKMNYPMNLMCLFVDMKEMLGKDYEEGLANLKRELEK